MLIPQQITMRRSLELIVAGTSETTVEDPVWHSLANPLPHSDLSLWRVVFAVAPVSFVTVRALASSALFAKGDTPMPCRPSPSSMKLKVTR